MKKMNRFSFLFCLLTYLLADTEAALDAEGIVGGETAKPDEYNYQISLESHGRGFCGGSIIGDYHILTAAHCVTNETAAFTTSPKKVVAGVSDLSYKRNSAVTVDVEKVYIPSEYVGYGKVGDIAVLKLKQSLGLKHNKHLSKLELPMAGWSYAGQEATITGYGWNWVNLYKQPVTGKQIEIGGNYSLKKKFAVTDVITNAQCESSYGQPIPYKKICAKVHQRHSGKTEGVCAGDSGGPLVYDDRVVIGTVSASPLGCNESVAAGIYTRVSTFLDFIKDAMADRVTSKIRVYSYEKGAHNVIVRPTEKPSGYFWSKLMG